MSNKKLCYIDLFAGAGGLSEGFMQNGFIPIAHIEMDKYACDTLRTRASYYYLKHNNNLDIYYSYLKGKINREELYSNIPNDVLDTVINKEISDDTENDIFEHINDSMESLYIKDVDIIVGGPPCQAYSIIGRARDKNGMKGDKRNYLYLQYMKFLNEYKPKMFIFENVPGLLTANNGSICENLKLCFEEAGYEANIKIMNARDFGVLQNRKRVIIIGKRNDCKLEFPEYENQQNNATVNDILSDLCPLEPGQERNVYSQQPSEYLIESGIRSADDILTHHQCRTHIQRDRDIYWHTINTWNQEQKRLKYNDLPEELCTHKNRKSFLDRFKVVAGDLNYSHTMTAHISKDGHHFIHPDINQNRSISVRESARIQSFPDNYYFEGPRTAKFVQIGNAVPPLMAKGLAKGISDILKE